MGHKMVAQEAMNIATAFAQREWGTVPEWAHAERSQTEPSEWVVHVPFPGAEDSVRMMDPSSAIVIVNEITRQACWFPVL